MEVVMNSRSIILGLIIGLVIGGLMGYIVTPSTDASGLESQIEQLEQQVRTLETSLDDKDSQITLLEGEIDKLEGQAASLEGEIQQLQISVDIAVVAVSFSRPHDTSSLLQHWIGRANETIRLMVMLITQDELANALISAHNRGVNIDIIIDDEWLYSSGSDYQEILDAGIDIRGDNRGGLMHHKVMIIDGYVVLVGSYNWSASAEDSNDENVLILKSSLIAQNYLEEFNRIRSQTTEPMPTPTPTPSPTPTPEPEVGYVVINEVELNPAGIDTGHEWVELSNPSDEAVDIGGWMIETTHEKTVIITIPSGTVLDPGEHRTYTYSEQWLDNEDELVVLWDAFYNVVDETPVLNDDANDNRAWARYPNGYDTDSPSDWMFQYSTKGYSND